MRSHLILATGQRGEDELKSGDCDSPSHQWDTVGFNEGSYHSIVLRPRARSRFLGVSMGSLRFK